MNDNLTLVNIALLIHCFCFCCIWIIRIKKLSFGDQKLALGFFGILESRTKRCGLFLDLNVL